MNPRSLLYAALFMFVLIGAFQGGDFGERMAGFCLIGIVYVCGGTHGLYLGLSHGTRIQKYVDRRTERYYAEQSEGETTL